MDTNSLIASLIARGGDLQGSRSTILAPLTAYTSLLVAASLVSVVAGAPLYLTYGFAMVAGVFAVCTLFSYFFCLLRMPDALRTEKFLLGRMAIEKQLMGDSDSGTVDQTKLGRPQVIDAPPGIPDRS